MRKQNPDPEKKLKGNAYARALHKVRAYAQGLEWDIRLHQLDGFVELEPARHDGVVLKYSSPVAGTVALKLDPHKSEASVVSTQTKEKYTFPIYCKNDYLDDVRGGIEQAIYAFSQHAEKKTQRHPRMSFAF